MAIDAGTGVGRVVIATDPGIVSADGSTWTLFESGSFQIAEMPGRQFCDAMAIRAAAVAMFTMLT